MREAIVILAVAAMLALGIEGWSAVAAKHEMASKRDRIKPQSAPEIPYDPTYLKGTNIPRRTTAPSSN
jgi:hypothetical protein